MLRKLFLAAAVMAASTTANAGTVALFSDVNIYLQGFTDAGNKQVLTNLLGTGTNVLVSEKPGYSNVAQNVNGHYNGLGGVTSSIFGGTLTGGSLSGIDLLFLDLNYNTAPNYSLTEATAISGFISGGGSVGISAETGSGALSAFNSLFTNMGLSMQFAGPRVSGTTTVLSTTLTQGVTTFTSLANNTVTVNGGTAAVTNGSGVVVAFETFADTPAVPLPAGLPLVLTGFAIFGFMKTRKRAS